MPAASAKVIPSGFRATNVSGVRGPAKRAFLSAGKTGRLRSVGVSPPILAPPRLQRASTVPAAFTAEVRAGRCASLESPSPAIHTRKFSPAASTPISTSSSVGGSAGTVRSAKSDKEPGPLCSTSNPSSTSAGPPRRRAHRCQIPNEPVGCRIEAFSPNRDSGVGVGLSSNAPPKVSISFSSSFVGRSIHPIGIDGYSWATAANSPHAPAAITFSTDSPAAGWVYPASLAKSARRPVAAHRSS